MLVRTWKVIGRIGLERVVCDGVCVVLSDAGYVTGRAVGIWFVSHGRTCRDWQCR